MKLQPFSIASHIIQLFISILMKFILNKGVKTLLNLNKN